MASFFTKVNNYLVKTFIGKPIGFAICKRDFAIENESKFKFIEKNTYLVKKGERFVLCKSLFGKTLVLGSVRSPKMIVRSKYIHNFKTTETTRLSTPVKKLKQKGCS